MCRCLVRVTGLITLLNVTHFASLLKTASHSTILYQSSKNVNITINIFSNKAATVRGV